MKTVSTGRLDRNASNWVRSLAEFTDDQLLRIHRRIYRRMAEGGGMFGVDRNTALIVCPDLLLVWDIVSYEIDLRDGFSVERAAGFVC